MNAVINNFLVHLASSDYVACISLIEERKSLLVKSSAVVTAVKRKHREFVNSWHNSVNAETRQDFRDFSVVYGELVEPIYNYPDGLSLLTPIEGGFGGDTTRLMKRRKVVEQSAVVICFRGDRARLKAKLLSRALESAITSEEEDSNNVIQLSAVFIELNIDLVSVKPHDCRDHDLG